MSQLQDNPPESIPDDLKQIIVALQGLTSVVDLLEHGAFSGSLAGRVYSGITFTKAAREQILAQARAHEFAHTVGGLDDF